MAETKTKGKIIDVARELFAKQGVDRVTMGRIASAAGIGRRTIYTYFKGKEEIYLAVVKAELDGLSNRLAVVANASHSSPDKRIIEMIFTRLNAIKEVVLRNGSLRADFFRDIFTVEIVRRHFDRVEIELLRSVLAEGVEKDIFGISDVETTAQIMHYCLKGLEVPYIRGTLGVGMDDEAVRAMAARILTGALRVKNK